MTPEQAEIHALAALTWLAGNDELWPVFLGATGATAQDLSKRAEDPEFLIAVLDFVLMDDAWILAFCDHAGYAYEIPQRARLALPGGAQMHWT